MDKKIRIGVVGTGRGKTFMKPAECTGLKLAAVCDRRPEKLAVIKEQYDPDGDLMTFTDYDEMLKSDIDAVVLANYFNEHAPFAIKALRAGQHVLSECTAISTLAEGVALCRAVEETGKIYMIAENYPYTKQRLELKRVYDTGELGEMLYGEAEYCHPMSNSKTYKYAPGEFHWRNQIPSTYYCTHAIAQIMHITDTMPVRVNGFVPQIKDQSYRKYEYRQQDSGGIIVCQMNNGAVVRTLQGAFRTQSGIARLYGTKGSAEVERQTGNIVVYHHDVNGPDLEPYRSYEAEWPEHGDLASEAGHGGGDFWVQYYFGEAIRNNEQPYLNVYRACAMSSIGILAWKSVLSGGQPFDVPNWADEEDRKKYENDNWTPFLKEGDDPADHPPRAVAWKPLPEAHDKTKAAWEDNDYLGLGWSKKDIDMSFDKVEMN